MRRPVEDYLLGNAVVAAFIACVHGGAAAGAGERRWGTLGAVLLSPRRWAPLWFGRALLYALNCLLISVFTLTAANLLLGLRIPVGALPGLACAEPATGAGYAVPVVVLPAVSGRGSRRRATFDLM
ncbi:hypothetical protein [Streptomyces sp. NPDC005969]|uniref:hypothetical protein n=1 Tax=Streptomyces sp. NPDC005969 TaxID=3156722 RepID=UPI0033E0620A